MFFICFPFLSYPIRPNTTTSIGYTKPHAKPSQSNLSSSCKQIIIPYGSNTLPIKKPELLITSSLSNLANTVNRGNICSSTSVNFHLPPLTLLVHKIILIIPTVTSFLYIFLCVQPSQQCTPKIFFLTQLFS